MVTRVLLIRHADTDTGGRLCGSLDVPLSPRGLAQVARLVRRLPGRPAPHALFTSTLRRARDVADALGRAWSLRPEPAEWAREIDCGELEGMPLDEVQRRFPALWSRNQAQDDDTFAWPGGESYADFRARIVAGLEATAAVHAGSRVAVVTHAGVIAQVLGLIRGRPAAAWVADRPRPLGGTEICWHHRSPTAILTHDDPDWTVLR